MVLRDSFFHKYWQVRQEEVTFEVKRFFRTGIMPLEWNVTNICLIPEKNRLAVDDRSQPYEHVFSCVQDCFKSYSKPT